MWFRRSVLSAVLSLGLVAPAFYGHGAPPSAAPVADDPKPAAHADIQNLVGTKLGTANFFDDRGRIRMEIDVVALVPGTHAVHILDKAVCDGLSHFASAGPHFNPENKKHGFQNPDGPHAGDLCNIEAGPDGHANSTMLVPLASLGPGANSLFHAGGTSVVLDENTDDYKTDPDGKSGAHVACGVIAKD